uniref:hypothetical protein n=1 Tax=Alysiella crassa TaxID=153491 RepID=UPI00387E1E28
MRSGFGARCTCGGFSRRGCRHVYRLLCCDFVGNFFGSGCFLLHRRSQARESKCQRQRR